MFIAESFAAATQNYKWYDPFSTGNPRPDEGGPGIQLAYPSTASDEGIALEPEDAQLTMVLEEVLWMTSVIQVIVEVCLCTITLRLKSATTLITGPGDEDGLEGMHSCGARSGSLAASASPYMSKPSSRLAHSSGMMS